MRYDDFSIKIEPRHGEEYPVLVLNSPAGQGRGMLRLPSAPGGLTGALDLLGWAVRGNSSEPLPEPWRDLARPSSAPPLPDPQILGGDLFRALFPEAVRGLFDRSLGAVEDVEDLEEKDRRGLRLSLHLDPGHPDFALLASLPWELLYWEERRQSLCLGRQSPLVRHLDVPIPSRPVRVQGSLRILVAWASPAGHPPLRLSAERQQIEDTWARLPGVKVEFLENVSAEALRKKLHEGTFHVLHFMGHGGFQTGTGTGALIFEDGEGRESLVPGPVLADLLRDFPSLRLVLLNACDTAKSSRKNGLDPFAGVAAALVLAGLPAVVAMQFPISDGAAIAFSKAFYERAAAGDPIDAAVSEGRVAIRLRDPVSLEWATPVLFLRGGGGRLFEIEEKPDGSQAASEVQRHFVDFSWLIEEKTRDFVGRRWLFDAVKQFTHKKKRGYFVLRGDPGIGKSTFLAEMVRRDRLPHHFNVRAAGIQGTDAFLANLSAQLIARYHLDYTTLPPDATRDARFLTSVLGKVAGKLPTGEKAILVVDALDEADPATVAPGSNILYLPPTLPDGVYIVVTTRRGPLSLRVECEQQVLNLEQDSEGNLADVRELVESKLLLPGIRSYLASQKLEESAFADAMVEKSQGNFMYLRYVLPEIESGAYQDLDFDRLPVGLENYYEEHWRRMRNRDEDAWINRQVPVLQALTVVEEPVSVQDIAEFSEVQERWILSILRDWDAFLYKMEVEEAGRRRRLYRLYHASFHDFIASKDEIADEGVDLKAAHKRIARVFLREIDKEL